jgi:8-oxo-dGTP pyrophosphatase MutT (NUDIX family)
MTTPSDRMITFTRGAKRFNLRIVGIAIEDGRVLLHQFEGDDFWALPGGRGELLEPANETLRREMQEELGIEVDVVRLLWLVENFFEYQGLQYHELGLYFLMHLPPDWPLRTSETPFAGHEGHLRLTFRWFPLDELEQIVLVPSFLPTALQDLPTTVQHVVHDDE